MPINFELTFTQPLLAQLDFGQPRGSKDMAKFITQNYVNTLLTGLPGGGTVPPVLPAPGLGSPPPPFPIPSIPILNFTNRQRAMERVLRTYFEAREILIQQAGIKGLIKSIKLAYKKYNVARLQLQDLQREAAEVQKEILELPNLLNDIKNAVTEIVDNEKQKIELLYRGLDQFKLTLTPQEYTQRFGREVQLLDEIRNFKITLNIDDYRVLGDIVNVLESRLNSLPSYNDNGDEAIFKKMLMRQVSGALRSIIQITNLLVSPEDYINYVRDLAEVDVKLAPLLDILYRYRFIRRKLEPLIIKLKRKIRNFITRIENKIRAKIDELKDVLKKKVKDLAQKKQGQNRKSIFLRAGKIITDFKKKYLKKIKNIRSTVSDVRTIITLTKNLIQKGAEIKVEIEQLFDKSFRYYLTQTANTVLSTLQPENSAEAVQEQLNAFYREYGITLKPIQDIINKLLVGKVTSPQVLIGFLEYKSAETVAFGEHVTSILLDAALILNRVRHLFEKKTETEPPKEEQSVRDFSMADILDSMKRLEDFLVKIQKKLVDFLHKQDQKLRKTVDKIKEDIELKLLVLVPIKSDIKDSKNKADIIRAKREKLKHIKKTVRNTFKIISIVASKILPAARQLGTNLSQLKWRYTINRGPLRDVINGIYDIKKLKGSDQANTVDIQREKTLKDIEDYFYGFELLTDFSSNFTREASNVVSIIVDRLELLAVKQPSQDINDLIDKIKQLKNYKNWKLEDLFTFFDDLNVMRILKKSYIKTAVHEMEQTVLINTTAFLDQVSRNPLIARLFPGLKPGQDCIMSFLFEGFNKIVAAIMQFMQKLYDKTLKPLVDKIQKKLKKIKDNANEWIRRHVQERLINLDLKLMSIAFNIATRVFWTGFSWITPSGVRYTCISIGPFMPLIKPKPDDGASVLVRSIAKNLNNQLLIMNGLVSPPPPTGIPPFPFVGYR